MAAQDAPIVEGTTAKPVVVIVTPTRELTIQIFEQALKFSHNSIVKVVKAYGGTSTNHQRAMILRGCHILVATPGRLNDFLDKGSIAFDCIKYFVLDEADRMLDMGFLPTLEKMLGHPSMTATVRFQYFQQYVFIFLYSTDEPKTFYQI